MTSIGVKRAFHSKYTKEFPRSAQKRELRKAHPQTVPSIELIHLRFGAFHRNRLHDKNERDGENLQNETKAHAERISQL